MQRIFINAPGHHGRAESARNRYNAFKLFFAVFQVDRVDDRLALAIGQRKFDRRGVSGIDHHRCLHLANQLFVKRRYVFFLVALRALQAYVHDMRAAAHLPPRNLACLFPLFFRHQVLEQSRPDDVCPFAYQQRPRAFLGFDSFDSGVHCTVRFGGGLPGFFPLHHLGERADMLFRCSAASAHDIQPAMIHEFLKLSR